METNQFLWKETEVDGAIPIVNFSINTKEKQIVEIILKNGAEAPFVCRITC